jgi:hypothetical protein
MNHHCTTHKEVWAKVVSEGWVHPKSYNGRVVEALSKKLGPRTPEAVRDAVLRLFVKHCLQYCLTAEELFQDLLFLAGYNGWIPGREQTRLDILAHYQKCLPRVRNLIHTQIPGKLSWTFDIWDAPNDGQYLSCSIHWLDNAWQKKQMTLSFQPVVGAHTGENVADELEKVSKLFELKGRLNCITVDNARENPKAIRLAGEELAVDEDHLIRCFAHVLNLVVKELYKDREVGSLRSKLNRLVHEVRLTDVRHTSFQDLCKERGLEYNRLENDNVMRWGSTFKMLESCYRVHSVFPEWLTSHVDSDKWESLTLSLQEWQRVGEVCMILKPFWIACVQVQSHTSPTLNVSCCVYEKLLEVLENTRFPAWVKPSVTQMKAKLEDYYGKTSDVYYLACFLDPRFKMAWCSSLSVTGLRQYESIKKKCMKLLEPYFEVPADLTAVPDQTPEQLEEGRKRRQAVEQAGMAYKAILDENGQPRQRELGQFEIIDALNEALFNLPTVDLVEQARMREEEEARRRNAVPPPEVMSYLRAPCISRWEDPLQWWLKTGQTAYPALARAARDYLAVPATTAASERVFSQGRQLISWTKHNLSPQMVEASMCLRSWFDHLPYVPRA